MNEADVTQPSSWTRRLRLFDRGLTLAGMALAFALASGWLAASIPAGFDAQIYWVLDPSDPYVIRDYRAGSLGYFYSPAFAQLSALLTWLPWEVFRAVWAVGLAAALGWLCGPLTLIAVLLPPVQHELLAGNINLIIGVALIAGLRRPWLWPVVALTKVTPAVALLWFVLRREWRRLGLAIAWTLAVVGLSFVAGPHLWIDWLALLIENAGATSAQTVEIPFAVRLGIAVLAIIVAARVELTWIAVAGAMLALPAMWSWILVVPAFGAWRQSRPTLDLEHLGAHLDSLGSTIIVAPRAIASGFGRAVVRLTSVVVSGR